VVLLGTSLTAGLGLDPAQAYPALLQAKADSAGYAVRIVNAGLSGETSAGAVRRASWVLDQPARLVVLEVGASAAALEAAYPRLPMVWPDFERGGQGVALIRAADLPA
jgi:lysophospholipase L1-like esterase